MNKQYKAFISYSHNDGVFAKWLHRKIENWKVPSDIARSDGLWGPVPSNIRPVFRDRDYFTGGRSLKEATIKALESSEFLVVICSPNSVNSEYVSEEVRAFKALGKADRVIPVIYFGEPGDPVYECFPDAVKFVVDDRGRLTDQMTTLIAPDARDKGDGKMRAVAKVVAGILGVTFDEIIRREEIAKKRRFAVFSGVATGFIIFATIFASFALWQNHQADLAISKSLFAIDGLIQRTDTLHDDTDIEVSRESMLLEQCDLHQGLSTTSQTIDFLSHSICIAEQAKARSKVEPMDQALSELKRWLSHLAERYTINKTDPVPIKNLAQGYIRALISMVEIQEQEKGIEEQTLVRLNEITRIEGLADPEESLIHSANEIAFWWYQEILEQQERWQDMQELLIGTIATRQKQSDSFIYDDQLNIATAELADLQRLLAWLQVTHLDNIKNAFKNATSALDNINVLESAFPESIEVSYQKSNILLTVGRIHQSNGDTTKAVTSYDQARMLLNNLLQQAELPDEALEQLRTEIRQLDELLNSV